MITLSVVDDGQKTAEFYEKVGLEKNENSHCLWAKNGEEMLGYSLFDIDTEKMTVRFIEPINDIALADGILRSTLHVAAERFVMNAFYADSVPEDFLNKIGFIKDEKEKRLDIDKLFKSCTNCGR